MNQDGVDVEESLNDELHLQEEHLMESVDEAKERLAALERLKKARSIGTQTAASQNSKSEVIDEEVFLIKFDSEGVPTLSSLSSFSTAASAAAKVWLLPCLRRPMLCYSGQKSTLLPPHVFLAYFQEILQFRLRFPVRPDCAASDRFFSDSSSASATGAVVSSSSSPLSLRATVASMRQRRLNAAAGASNSSSVAASASDSYANVHKSIKMTWRSDASAFDRFSPAQSSFPDFALKYFQAVYGTKATADIM
jgi:hypothetical protein